MFHIHSEDKENAVVSTPKPSTSIHTSDLKLEKLNINNEKPLLNRKLATPGALKDITNSAKIVNKRVASIKGQVVKTKSTFNIPVHSRITELKSEEEIPDIEYMPISEEGKSKDT